MNEIDKKECIQRYNNRLKRFGYKPETLGWAGGKERQYLRFKALMDIQKFLPYKIKSVLDVGCGFGDMGEFLRNNYSDIKYCGIDINEELIKVGKNKFKKLDLRVGDILEDEIEQFDLVVESGIFNYQMKGGYKKQLSYIKKMLDRFYELSNYGFSADFMSSYVDFQSLYNFHLLPEDALNITKSITDKVILRYDYLKYEFCIYGIKNEK